MNRIMMYSPVAGWRKGDLPTSPSVYIELGTRSVHNGHLLLSPDLVTDREIEEAVSQLKRELDEFSKVAKRELGVLRKRMREK